MPPKKTGGASKKVEEKKKQKIVEDKTFGLKNKNKSKQVQKYIKGVQVAVQGPQSKRDEERKLQAKRQKEEEKERLRLEAQLFKPTVAQTKVPIGIDPKSVVCEFFKKGLCTKGDKCKYSHNFDQERKSEKIDLYTDRRDIKDATMETDTMDAWDQKKLENVIEKKHAREEDPNSSSRTKIVCKYFLEAIEQRKYGWFWECPNGGDKCQYQHRLPPGFELIQKKDKDKLQEAKEETPLEDVLEAERAKLTTRTPLTLERFLKWRADRQQRMELQKREAAEQREKDLQIGRAMRSGREMFAFNPQLFVDDLDALDTSLLEPLNEQGQKDAYSDNDSDPENGFKNEDTPEIFLEATGTSITLKTSKTRKNGDRKEDKDFSNEKRISKKKMDMNCGGDINDGKAEEGEKEKNGIGQTNECEKENDSESDEFESAFSNGIQIREELFTEEDLPEEEEDVSEEKEGK